MRSLTLLAASLLLTACQTTQGVSELHQLSDRPGYPPAHYVLAGRAMEAAGHVTTYQRSRAEISLLCGEGAVACSGVTEWGRGDDCYIMVTRESEHPFVHQDVLDHELAHCARWRHPYGMVTEFRFR